MKISIINSLNQQRKYDITDKKQAVTTPQTNQLQLYPKVPMIYFGALYNINPQKINVESEIGKLVKTISQILETDTSGIDVENYAYNETIKLLTKFRTILERQDKIAQEVEKLVLDRTLNAQQKMDKAQIYKKELSAMKKYKFTIKPLPKADPNDPTDFTLINKLNSAISKGDFNLLKVQRDYYASLSDVTTVEEARKLYPKLQFPKEPSEIIAKKIVDSLTRDFYEEFDEILAQGDNAALDDKIINAIAKRLANQDIPLNKERLINIFYKTSDAFAESFRSHYNGGTFSTVPVQRKANSFRLSSIDKKMVAVNYDDFALTVMKEQILNLKKVNDIVYERDGVVIPIKMLADSEYKVPKVSQKIQRLITSGLQIENLKRNYDKLPLEELKDRLNYYSTTELGNDEAIFEKILTFYDCRFAPEDIEPLRNVLRVFDDIHDGDITLQDGIKILQSKDYRPKGTERLNELDRKNAVEKLKLEQQRVFELTKLQDDFDSAINSLYMNNMNGTANICIKYRPENLEQKDTAEYLIRIINSSSDFNKIKMESRIARWDTYNYYAQKDKDSSLFNRAVEFAKLPNGCVDEEKAGQYIINSEIVENYPDSLQFTRNSDILKKIMERSQNNEQAVKMLSMYDDYYELAPELKSKISTALDMFDAKNPVEKIILKSIIENDYVNSDTTALTKMNITGSETISSKITASAKQQILDKYKFPLCLDYFKSFEDAITGLATSRDSAGIKKTGTNNENLAYKMELKIIGSTDRLFSSKNNYVFDIYSEIGLH